MRSLILCVGLLFSAFTAAQAGSPMVYVHNAPESAMDKRYNYHWEILATALEKTTAEFGPFEIKDAAEAMTESRQMEELHQADGALNMVFLGTTLGMEADNQIYPVRIPVDKGLSGYRILLIRAEDGAAIGRIHTMAELKRLTFGLGSQWLDNKVFQANSMRVVNGANYDGLFRMLMDKDFDVFPRSAREIMDEFQQRKAIMPGLAIEGDLLLHYYWPMYFWFANTAQGRNLGNRAEVGMRMMIKDGSYQAIFLKYFKSDIDQLKLSQRIKNGRFFELANPILPPRTPVKDASLWYRP